MQEPNAFPRWADAPPVAPPTTITEPSDPEKDVGFQPGVQAQVTDFGITNVLNNHTYNARLNGVSADYLSDGTATAAEIRVGLRDAVNALAEPVTAVDTGTAVRVTADVAGVAFVADTTDATNVSVALVTANKSNKPIRQFLNWFFNLVYQWVTVLWQFSLRTDDMHPDQVLAGGDLPSIGAGLTIAAGDFAARAYAAGRAVPTTSFPAAGDTYVYSANSDTYWDLGVDRTWTPVVVASGAGAPALTANSVRAFAVRTDATDRTLLLLNNMESRVRFNKELGFEDTIHLGVNTFPDADTFHQPRHKVFVERPTWGDDKDFEGLALYGNNTVDLVFDYLKVIHIGGGTFGRQVGFVRSWRAYIDTAGDWIAPLSGWCYRLDFKPGRTDLADADRGGFNFFSAFAASDGATITWAKAPLSFENGIRLGTEHNLGGGTINEHAQIEFNRGLAGERYTLIARDATETVVIREYLTDDAFGTGLRARVRTVNAEFLDATDQWERDAAGDATLIVETEDGTYAYHHLAASASPWSDATTAGNWAVGFSELLGAVATSGAVDVGGALTVTGDAIVGDDLTVNDDALIAGDLNVSGAGAFNAAVTVQGALTVVDDATITGFVSGNTFKPQLATESPAAANTLYRRNLPKCYGFVSVVDAVIVESELHGCSVVINGAGLLEVTMNPAMGSLRYHVDADIDFGDGAGGGDYTFDEVCRCLNISASVFRIALISGVLTLVDLNNVANDRRVGFAVYGVQ